MVPRGVEGGLIGIVRSVGVFDDMHSLGVLEGGVWREDCRRRSLLRRVEPLSCRYERGLERCAGSAGVGVQRSPCVGAMADWFSSSASS